APPSTAVAGGRLASASRPSCELKRERKRSLAREVLSSRCSRMQGWPGHVGCVCSLGERRDGDQRGQRESGDEFPHDTSPWYGTLSKPTEFVSKLALSHMGLKESFDNREKTECLHCQILRMAIEDCAVPRAPIRSPQLLAARDPKCSWR